MSLSRRGFLVSAAAVPILSEGVLSEMAAGPVPATAPDVWLRLSNNENPWGPCQGACDAVIKAAPKGSRYPQAQREQMQTRLAKLHDVDREMIIVGNGSGEILRMAVGAFAANQRNIVVADPTYEACGRYAAAIGSTAVKVALTSDFRHDLRKMAATKAGLIYVCNPNNPTASLTPMQEVDAMVAAMPAGSVALIDEAYCHFVDDPPFETAIKHVVTGKDVVVARTFSKIYGLAGYRVGYAIAKKPLADAMRRQILDNNLNMMGLEAALASLDVADLVPRNREKNQKSRRILLDWCDRHKMKYAPAHTNFVFFHINRPVAPVIQALRARGVAVGRPFPPLLDWMRVSIGTDDEMRKFIREFEAVLA